MTRKQERKARVGRWLAIMATGLVTAGASMAWLPGGGFVAVAAALAALAVGHRIMIGPRGVAVLTYHSVSADARWLPWSREITVHPDTFARQMATLASMGSRVMATRDWVSGATPVPDDAVVLHFDDGYLDNWVNAVPVLARYGFPATFFASLDFVEPGDAVRQRSGDDSGYMTWTELAAIEVHPLFEVEPHGVDHARVPISARVVDRLTPANWRRHAWVQWRATAGAKHAWFRNPQPVAVGFDSPVLASAPALSARAWTGHGIESVAEMEGRIERDLSQCRAAFVERLGRAPEIFCWPENAVGAEGRRIAADLGYRATTGGRRRNVAGEPRAVISRIHIGDRALGWRWLAVEGLAFRAAVRLAQGNHYWYLVVAPTNLMRSVVMRLRARMGHFA